jgi:hypothetical protein
MDSILAVVRSAGCIEGNGSGRFWHAKRFPVISLNTGSQIDSDQYVSRMVVSLSNSSLFVEPQVVRTLHFKNHPLLWTGVCIKCVIGIKHSRTLDRDSVIKHDTGKFSIAHASIKIVLTGYCIDVTAYN